MAYSRAWWRDGNEGFIDDLDLRTKLTALGVLSLGANGVRSCLSRLAH